MVAWTTITTEEERRLDSNWTWKSGSTGSVDRFDKRYKIKNHKWLLNFSSAGCYRIRWERLWKQFFDISEIECTKSSVRHVISKTYKLLESVCDQVS